MAITNVGLPGTMGSAVSSQAKNIFRRIDGVQWSDKLVIIKGAASRDTNNATHPYILQAGHILSKDNAPGTGDDKYKSTFLGTLTSAYTSGAVTLTVGVAAATEINRRYGGSGVQNFFVVHDLNAFTYETPSIDFVPVTHSAVDTAAGTVTISDLGVSILNNAALLASESVYGPEGEEALTPSLIVAEEFGIRVTDDSDASVDVTLDRVVVAGHINASRLAFYSNFTDGVQKWLKNELNDGRQLIFDDDV